MINLNVTDAQIEVIRNGLLALVDVINNASAKKAVLAGQAGADSVNTVEQANTILKALADKEKK